jgi:hypothetical protein
MNNTNTNQFKIEKGIPMPQINAGRPCKYPWAKMNVGDSVFMDSVNVSVLVSALSYGKKHAMEFASRVENEGRRIWRVK